MKLIPLLLLAVGCGVAADTVEKSVHEAVLAWTRAAVNRDAATLDRFIADDLQYARASGVIETKSDYIRSAMVGPPRYESFTFSDVRIVPYGDTAVFTALVDVKLFGQESIRVRTMHVYVKRDGRWQMAAHQSTRVTP